MAQERIEKRVIWENDYIKHIKSLSELTQQEIEATKQISILSGSGTGEVFGPPLPDDFVAPGETTPSESTSVTLNVPNSPTSYPNFKMPVGLSTAVISNGKVIPPSGNRNEYAKARVAMRKQTNAAGFVPVSTDLFTFQNGTKQNRFAPDFALILPMIHAELSRKLGIKKVIIRSGYRPEPVKSRDGSMSTSSPHMWGGAVDIELLGKNRYIAADACWAIGLRAISIDSDYIHVDCGCPGSWSYGSIPKYTGPGSH